MYRASDAFFAKLKKSARIEHVRGSINGIQFDDKNILALNYINRSSDIKDVSIGYAYIGKLSASFVNVQLPRGRWRGAVISLEYGLEISENNIEYIPIGVFTVAEAEWGGVGVNIVAYDNMTKFDIPFNISETAGTPYDLFRLACINCKVGFELSEEDMSSYPNSDQILGLYPNNDIKTYRDFIGWLSQVVGGFATISRSGALTVKSYLDLPEVDMLTDYDRLTGSSFSDYETIYDGISVVEIDQKQTRYYSANHGAGSVINLGSNPFLQYGADTIKDAQRYAIADVVKGINYTPFNTTLLNNPAYDLGDVVFCRGGIAGFDTVRCCIMYIDWTFKEFINISGYGADPSLATGRSKTDKVLNGLLSSSKDELIQYTFTNAREIELNSNDEVTVISLKFATVTPKTVEFWAELDLNTMLGLDSSVDVEVRYYLNESLIPEYQPKTSWNNSGMHLMHLMYYLKTLEGNTGYTFEVRMILNAGLATIDVENIHAMLKGQGLAAVDTWNGQLDFEDEYSFRNIGASTFNYSHSDISIETQIPIGGSFEESFSFTNIGTDTFGYTEEIRATTRNPVFKRITEDGATRITEDKNIRTT